MWQAFEAEGIDSVGGNRQVVYQPFEFFFQMLIYKLLRNLVRCFKIGVRINRDFHFFCLEAVYRSRRPRETQFYRYPFPVFILAMSGCSGLPIINSVRCDLFRNQTWLLYCKVLAWLEWDYHALLEFKFQLSAARQFIARHKGNECSLDTEEI